MSELRGEMKNLIVEISQFKLVAGVSDEEFLKESEAAEATFFEKQGGYIGSELMKKAKGNRWAKVTNWNSMEDVRKTAKVMSNSPVARSLMQKIDSSSILCNFYEKVPVSNM